MNKSPLFRLLCAGALIGSTNLVFAVEQGVSEEALLAQLEQVEFEIASNDAQIKAAEATVASYKQELKDKEIEIMAKDEQIVELERQISEYEQSIAAQ